MKKPQWEMSLKHEEEGIVRTDMGDYRLEWDAGVLKLVDMNESRGDE